MRSIQKGQTAMEYLMTYGWAILIIIIVAAALFALGVFNPGTFTQSTAVGFPNFQVPAGAWTINGDDFFFVFANQAGATITLDQVDVTIGTNTGTNTTDSTGTATPTMNPGQQLKYSLDLASSIASGSSYTATVEITYTNQNTGLQLKSAGTVTGVAI